MFITVDRMQVKPDRRQAFTVCWRTVSEATQDHAGSLGSRLHVTEDGNYVDYTQWPDRTTYERRQLPDSYADVRQRMRDACEVWERTFEMDVADDHLAAGD
ncbi:MAG: antibiotic biosynthesis monooxygenase [Actinomycetota bacterium]|nr:antibiotic biosynthesis monooxygenase [Actinomycetota bacterium]